MTTLNRYIVESLNRWLALLLLAVALPAAAADYRIEAWISITETPTNGNSIVWSTTRTWTNTVTDADSEIQATNNIGWSRTNLFGQLANYKVSDAYSVGYGTNTNDVIIYGITNTALAVTIGGSWASVRYYTNPVYGAFDLWVPFPAHWSNALRQFMASALVDILNTYPTNQLSNSASMLAQILTTRTNGQSATNLNLHQGRIDGAAISNAPQINVTILIAGAGSLIDQAKITNAVRIDGTMGVLTSGQIFDAFLSNVTVHASNLVARGGYQTNVVLDKSFATNLTIISGIVTGSLFTVTGNGVGTWVTISSESTTAALGGAITLARSRQGTNNANASDVLGQIVFSGMGDSSQRPGGRVRAYAMENFNGSNAPTYVEIQTTPTNAAQTVGRLRVDYRGVYVSNKLFVIEEIWQPTIGGVWTNSGAMKQIRGNITTLAAGNNILTRPTNNLVRFGATAGIAFIAAIEGGFGDGDWFDAINETGYGLVLTNDTGFTLLETNRLRIPNSQSAVIVPVDGTVRFTYLTSINRWYPAVFGPYNVEATNVAQIVSTNMTGTPAVVGANSNLVFGAGAGLEQRGTNGIDGRTWLSIHGPGLPPIGGVIAWCKSLTNTIPTYIDSNYWAECNGQILTNASSPLNGWTLPDLNGALSGTNRFLMGGVTSGTMGGTSNHTHVYNASQTVASGGDFTVVESTTMSTTAHLPPYYQVVWVMRIR
jgi:hypothetical protein